MIKFIVKRILWMIPVLIGVIFVAYTINTFTPGDPVVAVLGSTFTQEEYDAKEAELGLDKPFLVQFFNYVKNIVTRFDFGSSYQSGRPVGEEIMERFPITLKLGLLSSLVTIIIGIPTGIVSATRQYSRLDYAVTTGTLILASLPSFWLGLMMMLLFALKLGWLPASGISGWKCWIMPVLAQGLAPVCTVTRMTRSNMLEVIRQDYIRTARAKGLTENVIIKKHALKNALLPVITLVGMQLGTIMGGSIITESIFAIPGMGSLMVTALNNKDYPIILGVIIFICVSVSVMNLAVDLTYAFVDPRIKAKYTSGRKQLRPVRAERSTGEAA